MPIGISMPHQPSVQTLCVKMDKNLAYVLAIPIYSILAAGMQDVERKYNSEPK
jgi:hypothetical protein